MSDQTATIAILIGTPAGARLLASGTERDAARAAELFLLQHTCHWFCRTKVVASARMIARHQTSYEQLVAAVLPQTRAEYLALMRRGPGCSKG